jgi:uncharacterized protein (TIGR02271 family)
MKPKGRDDMAQKPAVHIELRDGVWAVVREGNKRATSTHPTQAEAAEIGRELARRDGTEFFLHGQDGQIREHRDYREEASSADEGPLDTALGTVGTVADAADGISSAAAQDLGVSDARPETGAGTTTSREGDGVTHESSGRESGEVGGLAETGRGESVGPSEERYGDYGIYDQHGERIGPLSDLFVDEGEEPEYVGVEPGTITTNRSILIPAEVITIDDRLRRMVVSRPKSVVETAPSLGYDEEVTPEFERRVRLHYALPIAPRAEGTTAVAGPTEVGSARPSSGVSDREEDEVRVRRSEEELLVGRRERKAGAMRIRKRVRTDRQRIEVPKKRVEVTVERVPVEGAASTAEGITSTPKIGEEEIVVPIVEEEIVVEKRPVVKEEVRIRKEVVEDVEVVEEDVRKEEVEVVDQTDRETDV